MPPSTMSALRPISRLFTRHYSAPAEGAIPAAKQKYVPTSGTYPQGFSVSGVHVGVKPSNKSKPDLAFITSDRPANAAAVFTQNKFQAAPVQVSRSVLEARQGAGIRSIIINSGCANAVTGNGGLEDARAMASAATSALDNTATSPPDSNQPASLVMSTGVIGQRLPIDRILNGIPKAASELSSSHSSWLSTAKAIMTTDTFPKLLSTTYTLPSFPNTTFSLAGMTKGAGMIHPNMATLLGIMCTDAPIAPAALKSLLTSAVGKSFNSISIDGDTSTNDTVAILANGAATAKSSTRLVPSQQISSESSEDYAALLSTLTTFSQQLAQLVVRDGEGATKFIAVKVTNAPTDKDAHAVASSVARSPLVKTALYGRDANWGRVLCAVGYTAPELLSGREDVIVPERMSVSFVPTAESASKSEGVLKLLVNGEPQAVDEARAARLLEDEDLEIVVDLGGSGKGEATVWTCDFSHEYVTINGDYRT
ncbi:Arginine biosynthesis bifunctional protein ArgJ, mitochondrial [Cyphellophora attinorum]|uniref:Arginine biosynthesis bifunctional protein ArgJ, mitochondrial n=1 Tax=Cyphellophora attinorum TaxID=1664694 RepID=A0A0N0NKA1_9EURO|nr:Arginine biosynthesis bifunctional protein ArgJ, mitochondrial [Phialophora attinorum]KPI37798.1 Arginine biosynthesis bifunctional protein ArgJ, mitochondrial [Phialophora attinorum]